mgnify:FL=1
MTLLNNLPRKLIFAIVIWLIGAVFFVGLTLNISWRLEDRGVAINTAGSLRKQTYYILLLLQTDQTEKLTAELNHFENKLQGLSNLKTATLYWQHNNHNVLALNQVNQSFIQFKKNIDAAEKNNTFDAQLLASTDLFVKELDALVKSIELENTFNIHIMRITQIMLMLMALLSAILSLLLLNKLVIKPLSTINLGLQKITEGDLTTRLNIDTNDEFHLVSEGFNQMALHLENLYQNLEELVKKKTIDLETNNQELSTLYKITSFLHKEPINPDTVHTILETILQLSKASGASIRLLNQQGQQMDISANINLPDALLQNKSCLDVNGCFCGQSIHKSNAVFFPLEKISPDLHCHKYNIDHLSVYKIQLREQTLGLLTLYFEDKNTINTELRLIHLLCTQLAIALKNNRLILKDKQYAVLEERNIMAQGLHDSIAQSLSFLNLQLQMLEQSIHKDLKENIHQHLDFLKQGVQQCYDDVRELLNNFRFKLNLESFQDLLQSVIDRFKAQTNTQVNLNFISTGTDLSPQQQLQLIFIAQEALSNIRKHANATIVDIDFKNIQDITLSVQDNGIGFDPVQTGEKSGHHIGLSIMQERITQVNGMLLISSSLQQGTTISATIKQQQR